MQVQIGPYKDEGDRQEHVVIHHYDTWNMDHTLALIILPMLKQLKATTHGAPFVDMPDRPEHLQCYKEPEDYDTDKFHFQAWDWALDEMIWAFEHKVNDDWEDQFFGDTVEIKEIKSVGVGPAQLLLFPDEDGETEEYEMYEMIRDETPSLFDREGYKKYQERISNGFRLFGKYYQALWD